MAKGRIIRGGGFLEKLPQYEGNLTIAYGIGVVILIVLIYIVFFSGDSNTSTPSPSTSPTTSTTTTSTTTSPTTSSTTTPSSNKSIKTKLDTKITDLKKKISALNNNAVLTIIKGKLEDWGDDVNKLPADVKEKAMACYRNSDGCIF
jgi:hypothetical protein